MDSVNGPLGSARHWVFRVAPVEILVEIPNHDIPLDADRIMLPGGFVLTMDAIEHVITGRIIEFHNTGNSEYALQAIHAVRALSEQLDRDRLSAFILREGVADAAAVLMALVERPGTITVALLAYAHEVATRRRPWCDLRDLRNGPR